MKVLLVNPPSVNGVRVVREGRCMQRQDGWTAAWPPLSLAYCASVLRKSGIEAALRDCIIEKIDFESLKEVIRDFKPDLLVINTATFTIEGDLSVARLAREIFPGVHAAAMGIHVTALPDESFRAEPMLDYIIRGEPEETVRDLALAIQEGRDPLEVKGISFRIGGVVKHNSDRPFIGDLDALPFPAWDLVDLDDYREPLSGERILLISPGRGCPYGCSFCAGKTYYGSKVRLRSPKNIADELAWDGTQFGVRNFLFWIESFTINRDHVLALMDEIISRKLDIRFICNSRVADVDREMLFKLKKAGCWMIAFGIESGNQEILDSMKKATLLPQAKKAVLMSHEAGLKVVGHCIIGVPGESVKTIKQTMALVRTLRLDYVQYYCCVPFPGSDLYREALEKGWINTDRWDGFEQSYSVMDLPNLDSRNVMKWRKKAFLRFYLSPGTVFRILGEIRSLGHLKRLAGMVNDFLFWILAKRERIWPPKRPSRR
ncbi:MAG: radical SAM protein [bacterium]